MSNHKGMIKPKKIKTKVIKIDYQHTLYLSICKTIYFYDIVLECENYYYLKNIVKKIKKISSSLSSFKVIKKGVFGKPIVVLDTFTSKRAAKRFYNYLKNIINDIIIMGEIINDNN